MAEPFIGEIRIFSFPKVPKGWVACDGSLLLITQNQALFSLLNNKCGGDGKTTFAVPDLRGKVMVSSTGYSPTKTVYPWASSGGVESVVLTSNQLPIHQHSLHADDIAAGFNINAVTPAEILADPVVTSVTGVTVNAYNNNATNAVNLNSNSITTTGASLAHENRIPFLALNVCIAVLGIYPPRN